MINKEILVSIITPVFNGERFLEKNILSIKNQCYTNVEHIIIDGGSIDGTLDIIKKYEKDYNLRWISEKDDGMTDAMNKGFNMANGDIVAWLDADNYYSLEIIDKVVDIFKQNSQVDFVYGNVDIVNDINNIEYNYKPPQKISFKNALIYTTGAIPPQPGVFFKKEIYVKSGGFNIKYKIAGDYDFWVKVLKINPTGYYYDVTFGSYKKVENAASQSLKGFFEGFREVMMIGNENKMSFRGKITTYKKYFIGYLSLLKKYLISRI